VDEETDPPEQPAPSGRPGPPERSGQPDPSERPGRPVQPGPLEPRAGGSAVCARCGATAEGETPPPTWVCSVEDGDRLHFCGDCARLHIRAIESRLDSLWW
jgi:hypothetical protein